MVLVFSVGEKAKSFSAFQLWPPVIGATILLVGGDAEGAAAAAVAAAARNFH